jgi:Kip1 ubiquitination-promoting complex protein 1
MGEAFDNIRLGPGMAYFPTVSLAFTEKVVTNFGSTPFCYPVPGFEPIQKPPLHDVARAEQLCKWLLQLLVLFDCKYEVR